MSKNLIIGIIAVIIVIIVAIVGYMMMNPATNDQSNAPVGGDDNSAAGTQPEGEMSFAEYIQGGGSYECTVSQNVGGTQTVGKAYINNGMVRGEFTTQVNGMVVDSTLIVRDGYTYTWTSALPNVGFKAKVVENSTPDTSTGTSGQYSFDATLIGDYDCQPWTVDDSKFVVPTSINFQVIN